jgi:hypothetical protein
MHVEGQLRIGLREYGQVTGGILFSRQRDVAVLRSPPRFKNEPPATIA